MPANDRTAARLRPWPAPLLVALAVLLGACGSSAAGDDEATGTPAALSVVATTSILADVAQQVAGDTAEVTALMEVGADPHSFEPSARQLAELQEADLVVANGGNLEEHLLGPLEEAERAGVPVFHAIDHVEPLTFGADDDAAHSDDEVAHDDEDTHDDETAHDDEDTHSEDTEAHDDDAHSDDDEAAHDDGHAHDAGAVDPHFWTDPSRMADVAHALGERIGELSGDAGTATARADEYAAQLEEVDARVAEALEAIPDDRRTLVTNHEAFGYFAERYGFTIVGTVIPSLSTGAEPSAQDIEDLAHAIEEHDVPAVFVENTASSQLAQTLATEVSADVQVVELYSDALGPEGSGAETYAGMIETDAELVVQALTG